MEVPEFTIRRMSDDRHLGSVFDSEVLMNRVNNKWITIAAYETLSILGGRLQELEDEAEQITSYLEGAFDLRA